MKKLLIVSLLFVNISFSKTFQFLQQNFSAEVIENFLINNKKKIKKYKFDYTPDVVKLEVIEPKLNKGEVITYTSGKKTLYSPKIKQTVQQKLSNEDSSIYSILEELSKMDKKETYENKNKKYIFENDILIEIIADKYSIKIKEYIGNKPKKIQYISNTVTLEYLINY
ncbi:hypothetical protein STFE110948_00740 [Streptobacillus felis]|uniref:Outer membrane lipoprotein carrier protein LolA n=1 Tax=Streptobacillus felis TaxID=1384509 RepID=A0A7Z0T6I2_9FUSO|nr:hypothetical protein [Streptobacillus felis]NYV27216.1 hypothetical protein [Streptobacillus felis]